MEPPTKSALDSPANSRPRGDPNSSLGGSDVARFELRWPHVVAIAVEPVLVELVPPRQGGELDSSASSQAAASGP